MPPAEVAQVQAMLPHISMDEPGRPPGSVLELSHSRHAGIVSPPRRQAGYRLGSWVYVRPLGAVH
jgi:hypothetical protein